MLEFCWHVPCQCCAEAETTFNISLAFLHHVSTGVFLEVMLTAGVVGVTVRGKDPPGEVPSMLGQEPLGERDGYLMGV